MLTPQQASKILTRQFNNKENLHRLTTEQAREINHLVAIQNETIELMRGVILRISERVANRWIIKLLFPTLAHELRGAARRIP